VMLRRRKDRREPGFSLPRNGHLSNITFLQTGM
jgi:hypothetical protein